MGYEIRTISDMHIGNELWWKEGSDQIAQLKVFLQDCIASKIKLLIFIGDVIEMWQTSSSKEQPKSFEQVIQMQDIQEMKHAVDQVINAGVWNAWLKTNWFTFFNLDQSGICAW